MTGSLRVLVVDDNPDDRTLVARDLRREVAGLEVTEAGDSAALEAALAGRSFDLVITDYHLRWTHGIAVLKAVQQRWPETPVIMFTGTGSEEIAVEAMKSGLEDYVLKSRKHAARLPAAVRRTLERANQRRKLRDLEDRYRLLFEEVPVGLYSRSSEGKFLDVNPALVQILGYPDRDTLMEVSVADPTVDPEIRRAWLGELDREGSLADRELLARRYDGTTLWIRLSARVTRDAEGRPLFYHGAVEDINERKLAQERAERMANFPRSSPYPVVELSGDGAVTYQNAACLELLNALGRNEVASLLPAPPAEIARDCLAGGQGKRGLETKTRDRTLTWTFIPVPERKVVLGYAFDISDRLNVEEQLRQSQKIEAIGRLAGGVAHDFNNLLTVITGHSQLLLHKLQGPDPLRKEVEQIRKAADRAASLTRQLLAFSRQQVLQPKILNLNTVVSEMEKMLRRLIGEDVELITALESRIGRVKVDPGQVEQVVMNLAVNARDAMPQGGHLTIETANVNLDEAFARRHFPMVPGRYVLLAVTDTGEGMDAVTQSHIFEPFFTTKGPGRGTGLGLSTVYGIVKQSGGFIYVHSEPERGASFKIYFPRLDQPADPVEVRQPPTADLKGSETVLVVEDEQVVRDLICEVLDMNGYKVLRARTGAEALQLVSGLDRPLHLVVTDVVMPQMSGKELGERLEAARPGMKMLFVSGYTDETIGPHGVLEPGTAFLQKPFTPYSLARKVREVLDATEAPPRN